MVFGGLGGEMNTYEVTVPATSLSQNPTVHVEAEAVCIEKGTLLFSVGDKYVAGFNSWIGWRTLVPKEP